MHTQSRAGEQAAGVGAPVVLSNPCRLRTPLLQLLHAVLATCHGSANPALLLEGGGGKFTGRWIRKLKTFPAAKQKLS